MEARGTKGRVPRVVERWGEPNSSGCVLAASISDRTLKQIEVLSPINGDLRVSISNAGTADSRPRDDGIIGLQLFRKQKSELSSRSCTLLTCTTKGLASVRSIDIHKSSADSTTNGSSTIWDVYASGDIQCMKVDGNEKGKLLGSFLGQCSGSIRSISRHPEHPVIASCGEFGRVTMA
ncbi:uncharacterized protein LOC132303896 isoform X2 [Cornus florida]|uniref:uncharacterized protein LOC132303896 isoform X2 n=1 Tax=Cornus florida TaxID=4283 RepID=UPI0028A237F2|nr:uncharacterized protein LOC132303896 isoform X2 [Cornus florida]XP_059657328.1 uncharacterized protein LOC132303896 isoform X2 [Cornus florida]